MSKAIPLQVSTSLGKAIRSGSYMVAIWRIENGKLILDRTFVNFPTDITPAIDLLDQVSTPAAKPEGSK